MTKLSKRDEAKVLQSRAWLGTGKVCRNCATVSGGQFRKCINPRCKGEIFRFETSEESNARLNAYDAEQKQMAELLTELSGGVL